jgi:hypothetical protein
LTSAGADAGFAFMTARRPRPRGVLAISMTSSGSAMPVDRRHFKHDPTVLKVASVQWAARQFHEFPSAITRHLAAANSPSSADPDPNFAFTFSRWIHGVIFLCQLIDIFVVYS